MPSRHHIHLISDSTGETLNALSRAVLALWSEPEIVLHPSVFVRSDAELETALAGLRAAPGLVCHTLVNPGHRARLEEVCAGLGLPALAALDPLLAAVETLTGQPPEPRVGQQHKVNPAYFDRIAALDFAIAHDDGLTAQRLDEAQVVLTGVSRTSKTPTCIFLAYRGIKAANVPLIPGQAPDPALLEAIARGTPVIGLTASPARLAQIRGERLQALGADRGDADYADVERIREEVADARLFFQRHDIPVIDVTRRSIEETAAAIQARLRSRAETRP